MVYNVMNYKRDLVFYSMSKQTQTLEKQTQTSENVFDVYKKNV